MKRIKIDEIYDVGCIANMFMDYINKASLVFFRINILVFIIECSFATTSHYKVIDLIIGESPNRIKKMFLIIYFILSIYFVV